MKTNITSKYLDDVRKYINFYKSTDQILINTNNRNHINIFKKIAKSYLNFDVEFVGLSGTGLDAISFTQGENPIDYATKYFKIWQAPIILLVPTENSFDIIPIESISENNGLALFGTWTNIEITENSLEKWFFESISTKYFWQELTGYYGYPDSIKTYKHYLKELIRKAMN